MLLKIKLVEFLEGLTVLGGLAIRSLQLHKQFKQQEVVDKELMLQEEQLLMFWMQD